MKVDKGGTEGAETMAGKPSPGSAAAIGLGCTCPVLDNGRGQGCGRTDNEGKPMFWTSGGCPLHGKEPKP